ncbi:MAG TPA: M20/M25/M40 family metallo-hydrolase [Puia sp.]|nr:M20/M25/M40 family metallo-hydrolase [Puia sp.]
MILRLKIVALILIIPFLPSFAQKAKKADKVTLANLATHIRYLADDKLEGRRTGSPGEKLAGDYISIEFARAGLQPRGDNNGWLQTFEVNEGRLVSSDSYFSLNEKALVLNKDYFPLTFSAAGTAAGSPAIALQESGEPWFLDLKDVMDASQGNPHFDLGAAIRSKAKEYSKKGANALILYNTSKIADNLSYDRRDRPEPAVIPILYITREVKRKYLKDESASLDIKIKVGFTEKRRTGHNVVGYLDNGAPNTVIIGAHYDHLGYGEDSNSLYRGSERMIHNGADDNASGVAATIELARLLKESRLKNNNYLFIAFSGEELGLFGSKYFTEHPTIDLKKVNYMINLDMIGRLRDSTHTLIIGGYGTSPAWGEACNTVNDKKNLALQYDSSGVGPSDHTSFYRKDIPVLFFFTGIHSDYHKPTDDEDKINYPGELLVLKYIYAIIEKVNNKGRITFAATRETQMDVPHFTVTLGIMPDYTFSGSGVRADGISEGRPAQKAGLKSGDVIVQLGSFPVPSMEKYMEALSKFKKGDTTTVKYRRGSAVLEAPVTF